jgi:hypothetical protein
MVDRLNRLLNWLFPPLPDALADRSRRPPGPWPDLGDVPPLVPAPCCCVPADGEGPAYTMIGTTTIVGAGKD